MGRSDGIRPPSAPSFTFIDLFAGIGGTRIAFQRAGGRCVFSSEWDRFAQTTYHENFGETPRGDIRLVSSSEVPDHDVLVAGFPCQPFSIAGVSKKNALGRPHGFLDETQGTLFFEIARIIKEKRPRAFLLENVRNLRTHDGGRTFAVIAAALDDLGYRIDEKVIDARLLVPQQRQRLYIVGFPKESSTDFCWPVIRDRHPELNHVLEDSVDAKYVLTDHLWRYLQQYAAKHREAANGFGFGLADLSGATRTLSARYYKDGSEIQIPRDGGNPRRLTPRECARLMGFPERIKIPVSDTQAYKQFGNSVVVPLVQKIASAIAKCLEPAELTLHRRDLLAV